MRAGARHGQDSSRSSVAIASGRRSLARWDPDGWSSSTGWPVSGRRRSSERLPLRRGGMRRSSTCLTGGREPLRGRAILRPASRRAWGAPGTAVGLPAADDSSEDVVPGLEESTAPRAVTRIPIGRGCSGSAPRSAASCSKTPR